MVYAPIYKDTYYTTTAASLNYTLNYGDNVIFSGRAVRMPNQDNIRININKLCQNYLWQDIDELLASSSPSSQSNSNAIGNFVLKNGAGTTLETYRFLYDWDYTHSWNNSSATLSMPVNGEFISGQMKLKTTVSTGNSSTINTVTTYRSTGTYNKEICGDYVLYYVNARGGWDAFAFHRGEKSENITQYNYSKSFNNNTYEFEDKRYVAEIMTSYKLTTGWLTDEQSKNFAKNVISTTKAYLHNVTEGWIKPVLVSDTSVVYKEQENIDDIVYYQITVRESQIKQRI